MSRSLWPAIMVIALVGCTAAPPAGPTSTAAAPEATDAADSSPHPFAGDSSWIAYHTGESARLVRADGTDDREIAADSPGSLLLPSWSPDGTRLVLASRRASGTEPLIEYVLSTDSYDELFPCDAPCLGDDEPAYSPDGTKVAFLRYIGPFENGVPSDCGLWIGDVSTREVEQITSNVGCDREYGPRWSPDGAQLTYFRWHEVQDTTTETAIFVINADGTGETQLTGWEMFASDPDWSPDGEWIVFATNSLQTFPPASVSQPMTSNLHRMRPDGSGVEQLTAFDPATGRAGYPRFTPDGDQILFAFQTSAGRELAVIPADGGDRIVIAIDQREGWYRHPTWQP